MRYGLHVRAAAVVWLCCASHARSNDYTLSFEASSATFVESQANNRDSIARILSLVEDYGGRNGIQFVLLGELPAPCLEDSQCTEARLLRQRVEAVIDYMRVQSGSAEVAQAVRWQPIPQGNPHLEGLRLRVRDFASQTFSSQCPYRVSIHDPRFPKTLSPDDTRQDWVTVVGSDPVAVTEATSIRVYSTAKPSAQAELTANQLLKDHETNLDTGSEQIQWNAAQLHWEDGNADVVVRAGMVSRDISNEILPWNTDGSAPSRPGSPGGGCRIRFSLRRAHQ